MDQPGLAPPAHRAALQGLARINAVSRSVVNLWAPLRTAAARTPSRPLRVLDVACGGGDVAIGLWRRAKRAAVPLVVDGCDLSPLAIEHSCCQARRNAAAVRFFRFDALREPMPRGYDVIVSCLFLHHLDTAAAETLLRNMADAAGVVLISDLARSRAGLVMAQVATRLLTRSTVVHTDGPRSVRAAFTAAELRALAVRARLRGATVRPTFPRRLLLCWSRW